MIRTKSTAAARTLVLVATILAGIAVGATPAAAGELGRNCVTYYHQNNPATGWGFTTCVKLEHDTVTHSWRANGSVSTTTPGMVLHSPTVRFIVNNVFAISKTDGGPAASSIPAVVTDWWQCAGATKVRGSIEEYVTWPNGVNSSITTTLTTGDGGVVGALSSVTC